MEGVTLLPLHYGKAPKWLFERMKKLGKCISEVVIDEFGVEGFLERLSDPFWFQALACTLGYDWHSSGSTPVTLAALKEGLNEEAGSYGIFFAGGKGKAGIKTPEDIEKGSDILGVADPEALKNASRISAKVDGGMVYDNISIYTHFFVFSKRDYTIIQQAMSAEHKMAIRFQWFSKNINDFTTEPHTVTSDLHLNSADLTYSKNIEIKKWCVELVSHDFRKVVAFAKKDFGFLAMPKRHEIKSVEISDKVLSALENAPIEKYEDILLTKGVGRKTLKSLALISKLIYDTELYERDPATFSFTVGGKDGVPYPISRKHYDDVVEQLKLAVENSKAEGKEKYYALRRLSQVDKN